MTTNVYDGSKRLLCSDSRWSAKHPSSDFFIFVDDFGFDKIEIAGNRAFLFAGRASTIHDWKIYLRSNPAGSQNHPSLDDIALLIVEAETGKIVAAKGQDIQIANDDSSITSFAGTGSSHAADCWKANGCARTAVQTAKGFDLYSGGEVRFLELQSRTHNLKNDKNYDELRSSFRTQGMVMYIANSHKQVPVNEAALTDVRVGEMCDAIAHGQIAPMAPCDAMYNRATDEEKRQIKEALDSIFG